MREPGELQLPRGGAVTVVRKRPSRVGAQCRARSIASAPWRRSRVSSRTSRAGDRAAVGVDQAPADAGLAAVADGVRRFAWPLVQSSESVPVSVAPEPLAAPRSDGVTASTGYGPRSTTLPPASVTRTSRLRLAGRQRASARTRLAAEVRARRGPAARRRVGALLVAVGEADVVVLGADDARRGRVGDVDDLDALDAGVVGGGDRHRVRAVARAAGEQARGLDGDAPAASGR